MAYFYPFYAIHVWNLIRILTCDIIVDVHKSLHDGSPARAGFLSQAGKQVTMLPVWPLLAFVVNGAEIHYAYVLGLSRGMEWNGMVWFLKNLL